MLGNQVKASSGCNTTGKLLAWGTTGFSKPSADFMLNSSAQTYHKIQIIVDQKEKQVIKSVQKYAMLSALSAGL